MLEEALTALASTGGMALVTAMVTEGWEGIRVRFARAIGRGHAADTEMTEAQLERSRAALRGLTGQDLERAQAEQEIVWRTRLSDLLERDPGIGTELQALIAEVQAQTRQAVGTIEQHAAAFDQARQAVLGQGVQNVTFGDVRDLGAPKG